MRKMTHFLDRLIVYCDQVAEVVDDIDGEDLSHADFDLRDFRLQLQYAKEMEEYGAPPAPEME